MEAEEQDGKVSSEKKESRRHKKVKFFQDVFHIKTVRVLGALRVFQSPKVWPFSSPDDGSGQTKAHSPLTAAAI